MYLNLRKGLKKFQASEQFESIIYLTVVRVKYILHIQFVHLLCSGLPRSNTSYNSLFKHKRMTGPVHCDGG